VQILAVVVGFIFGVRVCSCGICVYSPNNFWFLSCCGRGEYLLSHLLILPLQSYA